MIDPLCLTSRTLESCRPAAERAEERVVVAAVECVQCDEVRAARRIGRDDDQPTDALTNGGPAFEWSCRAVARVVAFAAARGWR